MYRKNPLPRPVLCTVDEIVAMAPIDQSADIRYLTNSIIASEERWIVPALGQSFYTDFINSKNQKVTVGNQAAMLTNINNSLVLNSKPVITMADIPVGTWINSIEFCPANYISLWHMYLWQVCAEVVSAMASVPAWSRMTGQGIQENNPKTLSSDGAGAASVNLKTIEKLLDNAYQQRIKPLIARMQEWMWTNGQYNLFTICDPNKSGVNKQGKGGIILGLYRDENPNGPNLWQLGGQYGYGLRDNDDRGRNCQGNGGVIAPVPPVPPIATMWRSVKVYVKDAPDPLKLIAVGGGHTIQAEYASGATVTPMKIGDVAGYFANRPFLLPITLNGGFYPDEQYNSALGQFGGGFVNNDYIIITFLDNA